MTILVAMAKSRGFNYRNDHHLEQKHPLSDYILHMYDVRMQSELFKP
jgi:hypothetical protein